MDRKYCFYVIEVQNTENKMKSNNYFSIFRKNNTKVLYKNPNIVTFCDDVINDDVI